VRHVALVLRPEEEPHVPVARLSAPAQPSERQPAVAEQPLEVRAAAEVRSSAQPVALDVPWAVAAVRGAQPAAQAEPGALRVEGALDALQAEAPGAQQAEAPDVPQERAERDVPQAAGLSAVLPWEERASPSALRVQRLARRRTAPRRATMCRATMSGHAPEAARAERQRSRSSSAE
jgi:hypothetical protein